MISTKTTGIESELVLHANQFSDERRFLNSILEHTLKSDLYSHYTRNKCLIYMVLSFVEQFEKYP